MLRIRVHPAATGLDLELEGSRFRIRYPREVWEPLPETFRAWWRDNVAFVATLELPLLLEEPAVRYDSRAPALRSLAVGEVASE